MRNQAFRLLPPLAVVLALLPACLPGGFTDEELVGRVACGTGGSRFALDVNGPLVLAKAEGEKFSFDAAQSYSYSVWFQAHTLPPAEKSAPFVATVSALTVGGVTTETAFLMGLLGPTGATNYTRPICVLAKTGKAVGKDEKLGGGAVEWREAVTAGTWHHLRCWYDAATKDMYMSVDGAGPEESLVTLIGKQVPTVAVLLVGAVPYEALGGVAYDGLLDELHIAKGIAPSTVNFVPTQTPDDDAKTVALFHMDGDVGRGTLTDTSVKPSVAVQVTSENKVLMETGNVLPFVEQDCYGYSFAQAACTVGVTGRAPWCKTL